jgi:hypothetical protein
LFVFFRFGRGALNAGVEGASIRESGWGFEPSNDGLRSVWAGFS